MKKMFLCATLCMSFILASCNGKVNIPQTTAKEGSVKNEELIAGNSASGNSKEKIKANNGTSQANTNVISTEEAIKIAASYAQIPDDVYVVAEQKKEFDDGVEVYKITLKENNNEHEFDIDIVSGNVLKYNFEDTSFVASAKNDNKENTSPEGITLDKAKQIALNHSGVSEADASFTKLKLDNEHGNQMWEVDFFAKGFSYEIDIDYLTGNVLEYETDSDDMFVSGHGATITDPILPAPQPIQPIQEQPAPQPAVSDIGQQKAKQIALNHAGVSEADVTFIKVQSDFDDGRFVYEIEFYKENTEYDYDIDAATGDILSVDYDIENYSAPFKQNDTPTPAPAPAPAPVPEPVKPAQPQQPSQPQKPTQPVQPAQPAQPVQPAPQTPSQNTQISLEQAKQIALNHAKVSNATFTKAELDHDDGRQIYEIDFVVGKTEYDYEIDAISGNIIDFDVDTDD